MPLTQLQHNRIYTNFRLVGGHKKTDEAQCTCFNSQSRSSFSKSERNGGVGFLLTCSVAFTAMTAGALCLRKSMPLAQAESARTSLPAWLSPCRRTAVKERSNISMWSGTSSSQTLEISQITPLTRDELSRLCGRYLMDGESMARCLQRGVISGESAVTWTQWNNFTYGYYL